MNHPIRRGAGNLQPTKKWSPGESLLGLVARGDIEFLGHRGLRIKKDLSRDLWRQGFKEFMGWQDGLQFFIGDMLIHAEEHYGERKKDEDERPGSKYVWAMEECMREEQTLKNIVRVCRAVPPERRLGYPMSFTHHQEVAGLTPAEQTKWLGKAMAEDWSTRDLRAALRASGKTLEIYSEVPAPVPFVLEGPFMDFMRFVNRDLVRRMPDLVRDPSAKLALKSTLTQVIQRCEQICATL